MIKAVLFDLDGTISNSKEGITKSVQYALKSFGIEEPDLEKLTAFIGPPLVDSFQRYYNFTEEQAKEGATKFRERYAPIGVYECELFDGTKECLQTLKEQGYRIGIASSKVEKFCYVVLDTLGVSEYFDDVVGATLDGTISTKEEVLEEVFRRWADINIGKDEACLVGDTIFDINGAKEHDIPCVAVTFGFGDAKELQEAGAVALCDHFSQLPEILANL